MARHNGPRRRRGWLATAAVVAVILVLVAVSILRARQTHDRELDDLRVRTVSALAMIGLRGEVVSAGIDDGGSGSADCGIHVAVSLVTSTSAGQLADQLASIGVVYRDNATGGVVVVAAEPATTGADSWLDLRCRGPIPFARQSPIR